MSAHSYVSSIQLVSNALSALLRVHTELGSNDLSLLVFHVVEKSLTIFSNF